LTGAPDGHIYQLFFLSHPFAGPVFGGSVEIERCQEPVVFERFTDVTGMDRGMIRCRTSLN
jgi:hypothetical protein